MSSQASPDSPRHTASLEVHSQYLHLTIITQL